MDEKLKQQIVQLIQAASQGDQKATQAIQQIMTKAQQGDQQAVQLAQAIQTVMQEMQGQSQKAAHGAKLNYIKKLSHKCADDEELYYFKKGGSVDCGCKKKMEDGGKTTKKKSSIDDFKNRKVKKDCGGSKFKMKKGDKVKSAGAGCIAEFKKKFQKGGSLNGIPFIRKEG